MAPASYDSIECDVSQGQRLATSSRSFPLAPHLWYHAASVAGPESVPSHPSFSRSPAHRTPPPRPLLSAPPQQGCCSLPRPFLTLARPC